MDRNEASGLQIAPILFDFIRDEASPHTGISDARFWEGLAAILGEFCAKNRMLLERRDDLQRKIDEWLRANRGVDFDEVAYKRYLEEIQYILPEPEIRPVATSGVDPEIMMLCGPQLVVPLTNARYALNAANARWGSLYDALYGTDAIAWETERPGPAYDTARGEKVIAYVKAFLDRVVPLGSGSHAKVTGYRVEQGLLIARLEDGRETHLKEVRKIVGHWANGGARSNSPGK
jgi:malate synthase